MSPKMFCSRFLGRLHQCEEGRADSDRPIRYSATPVQHDDHASRIVAATQTAGSIQAGHYGVPMDLFSRKPPTDGSDTLSFLRPAAAIIYLPSEAVIVI